MFRLLQALLIGLALTLPILADAEAPAILLANVYRDQVDVSRYLASEKLDGVRAIWDGQVLRFRFSPACRNSRSTANCGSPAASSSAFPELSGARFPTMRLGARCAT